jgi:hypothetical protein
MVMSSDYDEEDSMGHISYNRELYMCAHATMTSTEAILDSGCGGIGIVNPNLFSVSEFCYGRCVALSGISGDDVIIDRYGAVPFFGDLPCSEECPIPCILGLSSVAEHFWVDYQGLHNRFVVLVGPNQFITFSLRNGLYVGHLDRIYDGDSIGIEVNSEGYPVSLVLASKSFDVNPVRTAVYLANQDPITYVLAGEVTQLLQDYNLKVESLPFNKKQLKEAAATRIIKRALGSPPNSTLWDVWTSGELRDNPTPRSAIQVLQDLEGEQRATQAGTTNVNINETFHHDLNPGPITTGEVGLQQTNQHLSIDVVKIGGLRFLVGVLQPLGYLFAVDY